MTNYILKYNDVIKNKNIKNCMSDDLKYRNVMPVIVCDMEGWKAFNTDEYYLKIQKPVEEMNIEELEQEIKACSLYNLHCVSMGKDDYDFKKNYGELSISLDDLMKMFHLRRSKCEQELLARKNHYTNLENIEFVLENKGFTIGISEESKDGKVFAKKFIDDSHAVMFWPGFRKLLIHEFDYISCHNAWDKNNEKLNMSWEEFYKNYRNLYVRDYSLIGNSNNPNGRLLIFKKLSGEWYCCGQEYSFEYKDEWENKLPSFIEDSIKNFHYPNCHKCGDPMYTSTVYDTKIDTYETYWKCCSSKKNNCRTKYKCGKDNILMCYPFLHSSFTLA